MAKAGLWSKAKSKGGAAKNMGLPKNRSSRKTKAAKKNKTY